MAYGYQAPKFGSAFAPKTVQPFQRRLSSAASGAPTVGDPFGLLGRNETRPKIDGTLVAPPKTPQAQESQTPQAPTSTAPAAQPQAPQPQGPKVGYDINTDPALQQVYAYTDENDQQIQSRANREIRDQIISSGLEGLAKSMFAGDESLATAAAKNPNSGKARLDHQKEQGLSELLTALTTGGHNLGYSGHRIEQEGELGKNYLSALDDLTRGTDQSIGGIRSAALAALLANKDRRAGALGDAYGRHSRDILSGLTGATDEQIDPLSLSDKTGSAVSGAPDLDYLNALVRAATTRRAVHL